MTSKTTETMNLNELIYLIHLKDEEAFGLLYGQLLPYTRYVYHQYCSSYLTFSEYESEAYLCLDKAILHYKEEDAGFKTHYLSCLRKRSIDLIRRCRTQTKVPPHLLISYESLQEYFHGSCHERKDVFLTNHDEDQLMLSLTCQQVLNQVASNLSQTDCKVLQMVLDGFTYRQISDQLAIGQSRIRRTFTRVQKLWYQKESLRQAKSAKPLGKPAFNRQEYHGLSLIAAV